MRTAVSPGAEYIGLFGEAAVHGCHCPSEMAVSMRKVLARWWVGVNWIRWCDILTYSWVVQETEISQTEVTDYFFRN